MRCADEDLRARVQVLNAENQLLHTANAGFDVTFHTHASAGHAG